MSASNINNFLSEKIIKDQKIDFKLPVNQRIPFIKKSKLDGNLMRPKTGGLQKRS